MNCLCTTDHSGGGLVEKNTRLPAILLVLCDSCRSHCWVFSLATSTFTAVGENNDIMADADGSGGRILDENGNLFGRINIIDLFVVLLVLAVVGAGSASSFAGRRPSGRY